VCLASVGPAIFIVAASYAGCNKITVVVLFTIAMGTMGAFYPGEFNIEFKNANIYTFGF
jgi:hypothetical protein